MSDLAQSLEKLLDILRLEVNHLRIEAMKGPLQSHRATALVNYIKVLSSVQSAKEDADNSLAGKSVEELQALAKALTNNSAKP